MAATIAPIEKVGCSWPLAAIGTDGHRHVRQDGPGPAIKRNQFALEGYERLHVDDRGTGTGETNRVHASDYGTTTSHGRRTHQRRRSS